MVFRYIKDVNQRNSRLGSSIGLLAVVVRGKNGYRAPTLLSIEILHQLTGKGGRLDDNGKEPVAELILKREVMLSKRR